MLSTTETGDNKTINGGVLSASSGREASRWPATREIEDGDPFEMRPSYGILHPGQDRLLDARRIQRKHRSRHQTARHPAERNENAVQCHQRSAQTTRTSFRRVNGHRRWRPTLRQFLVKFPSRQNILFDPSPVKLTTWSTGYLKSSNLID